MERCGLLELGLFVSGGEFTVNSYLFRIRRWVMLMLTG